MNYKRIYDNIIEKAKNRNGDLEYSERHHIKPKCVGGSDNKDNLVTLSLREHFICHLLLHKINPKNKSLMYAANMMTNRTNNSHKYQWLKERFIETERGKIQIVSEETKIKQSKTWKKKYEDGFIHINTGKKASQETREKMSKAHKGKIIKEESKSDLNGYILRYGEELGEVKYKENNKKKVSCNEETYIKKYGEELGKEKFRIVRENASNRMKAINEKGHSEETKAKLSEIAQNRVKIECPHCGKFNNPGMSKRWHFDNCKLRLS